MCSALQCANQFNQHKVAEILLPHTLSYLSSDYECPICFDCMGPPKMIYSCRNNFKPHFICSDCFFDLQKKECPSCKEDFNKRTPKRWPDLEKRAEELNIGEENN